MNSLEQIALALIAGIFSTKGWEYLNNRFSANKKLKEQEVKDTHLYRDDLRKEVGRLREEMIALYAERDKERIDYSKQFASLKEQLAVFKTRVEFLEREINLLESENKMLREALNEKEDKEK